MFVSLSSLFKAKNANISASLYSTISFSAMTTSIPIFVNSVDNKLVRKQLKAPPPVINSVPLKPLKAETILSTICLVEV